MKKLLAILLTLALSLSFTAALADTVTIGVPNDTTNEARALLRSGLHIARRRRA